MKRTAVSREARAPHRPGPGNMPSRLLGVLDLEIRRRIEGLLAGDFRSATLGDGTELAQVRAYVPGDDVRQIEWNVTARTNEVHVRSYLSEKALTTWLVLDSSASMSFGTADRRKADVAEGVALAVGHIATRRANRLGVLCFGGERDLITPPAQGRAGLMSLLTALRRADVDAASGAGTGLNAALHRAGGILQARSGVFVVSDFRGPLDWERGLGRLAQRHEVIAVEIVDPREESLPDIGDVYLVDPETGRQVRVDTRDRKLRQRFLQAAAEERATVHAALRKSGAHHLRLFTRGDWLRSLARFLSEKRFAG